MGFRGTRRETRKELKHNANKTIGFSSGRSKASPHTGPPSGRLKGVRFKGQQRRRWRIRICTQTLRKKTERSRLISKKRGPHGYISGAPSADNISSCCSVIAEHDDSLASPKMKPTVMVHGTSQRSKQDTQVRVLPGKTRSSQKSH